MSKYSLIFLSIFFLSCKHVKRDFKFAESQDSLPIEAGFFSKYFNVTNNSGYSQFQGYNPFTNELLLWNLDKKKEQLRMKLNISFSDTAIGGLFQFYVHNPDSIFLLTENWLLITDAAGVIKYKKYTGNPLKDADGGEVYLMDVSNQFPLFFDASKQDLYLHIMCNCGLEDPTYSTKRVEAKLHLANGEVTILNYHFPERYHGAFYGQNVFPFRTVNGPFHIISFESDDSLYVFNNSLNSLKKYPCRSRYQRIDFIPFDTSFYNSDNRVDRFNEHMTVSPEYKKILFDPYRNLYYRFFLREMPLKDEKGIYNNPLKKDVIIMVLDNNFSIIEEKNIGSSYLPYYSFVTRKGLYVGTTPPKNVNSKYAYFSVFSWN